MAKTKGGQQQQQQADEPPAEGGVVQAGEEEPAGGAESGDAAKQEQADLPSLALKEPALQTLLKSLSSNSSYVPDEQLLELMKENHEVRCQDNRWGQGMMASDIDFRSPLIVAIDTCDGAEALRDSQRETWPRKMDFLLALTGFTVDLSGMWKFPYLVFSCGGGAFFIPYMLMLFLGGLPLFYMELALGQYYKRGAITCWGQICPIFKGVGYTLVLIALYVDLYYNVIIGWCLYYFFASFSLVLPWTHCNNTFNTPSCTPSKTSSEHAGPIGGGHGDQQELDTTPSSLEYFYRSVLEITESSGIDDLGQVKVKMAVCVFAVLLIGYFSLWKGVMSSGKIVNLMAVLPYISLFLLLVMSATLPGAMDGVVYYLYPQFDKLLHVEVWQAAASQVFFSLGPGFGVLLSYASYNPFNNKIHDDAILVTLISFATSVLSGLVIFCGLGFICHKTHKPIEQVAIRGNGLVFAMYPEVIAAFPTSTVVALLYFTMLLCLGLTSSLGGTIAVITALSDEFPFIKSKREAFTGGLFLLFFFFSLVCVTQGGVYVIELFDFYCAQYSILVAVLVETMAISWFYGIDQFSQDISEMTGERPGVFWRVCWRMVAPLFILTILVMGLVGWEPLTIEYGSVYDYPDWADTAGWLLSFSSLLSIPVYAVYKLASCRGTFRERWQQATMPWSVETIRNLPHHGDVTIEGVKKVLIVSHKEVEKPKPGSCKEKLQKFLGI